ncbi:MAG: radical SAM protein [Brevefilum sp.]|nr:radical SAM protein [Brevefilum sp.]
MICSQLNELAYLDFGQQMFNNVGQQHIPLIVSAEVTMRCNLRCKHCYIPMAMRKGPDYQELSLKEYEKYFAEFADAGTLWLLLTGGEPFLRPDFLEIYDAAKRQGFIITIFTNGTLIQEHHLKHLAEYRPFNVEITLYGATQQTYEGVTGVPGSYQRCMQAIEGILAHNLPLKLKSTLSTLNVHELNQMEKLAESFGLQFYFDPVISSRIDGDHTPLQYRLTADRIAAIEARDENRAREWHHLYNLDFDLEDRAGKMYICGAGRTGLHMDSTGKLSLCMSSRAPQYDLRRGSFQQAWDVFFPELIERQNSRKILCHDCALRGVCGACPASAYIEVGDFEGVDPLACELTHERAKIFLAKTTKVE